MITDQQINQSVNKFVQNKKIPLGINTYKGNKADKEHIVSLPYMENGSIVIIGSSGWGKSVLLKRLVDYYLGVYKNKNKGLIIDTQGVDHRLSVLQNPNPHPLFYNHGEQPLKIDNIKSYCPIFASKKSIEGDKIIGISLMDLMPYDLRSSTMSDQSIMEFYKIKREDPINRKVMSDPVLFYNEVSKLKSSKQMENESALVYPSQMINYAIKESMMRVFSWWSGYQPLDEEKPKHMDNLQWELQKRPPYFVDEKDKNHYPTFWNDYNNNEIVLLNFMDAKEEREAMNIYGGYFLRDIYDYCTYESRKNTKFKGVFIAVEESNLFIDKEDKYLRKGSNFYFTELLCRGFKFEVLMLADFQSITTINSEIRDFLTSGQNPVIIGNLTKNDREYLNYIFPGIKDLKLRKHVPGKEWGGKEWAVYYNDKDYDTFVPYPSLSKYHKRGK